MTRIYQKARFKTSPFITGAFAAEAKGPFTDVSATDRYATALQYLKDKTIISGYSDGTFKPDKIINRAETVKMIMGIKNFKYWGQPYSTIIAGADVYSNNPFKDVSDKNTWYYQYVASASNNGIISGYPDRTFKPNQQVNRIEGLKMLMEHTFMRIDKYTAVLLTGDKPFNDLDTNAWYYPYVVYAADMGIAGPSEGGEYYGLFGPGEGLTRGSLSEMIYQTLKADESGKKPTVIGQEG